MKKKGRDGTAGLYRFMYILRGELLSLRLTWKWSLLIVLVAPLSLVVFLAIIFRDDELRMVYIISGNIVMATVTGTMLSLGQEFGVLKQLRAFDYYATLLVSKTELVASYVVRATITTLPSVFAILAFGGLFFDIQLSVNIWLPVVIVLAGCSLSAVGVAIGVYSQSASQASVITQVIQPVIVFLAPVFLPDSAMPRFLVYASYVLPTRYAARAIRASLQGQTDFPSIAVLLAFSLLSLFLIERRIDWRQ